MGLIGVLFSCIRSTRLPSSSVTTNCTDFDVMSLMNESWLDDVPTFGSLLSPATRLPPQLVNTTKRPSAEMAGTLPSPPKKAISVQRLLVLSARTPAALALTASIWSCRPPDEGGGAGGGGGGGDGGGGGG